MAVQPKTKVGRNDPCPCGSKLKFKFCHGDPMKQAVCNRVANEKMVELIRAEQKKRGLISYRYTCKDCGYGFDEPKEGVIAGDVCPKCESANIVENGNENENKSEGE